MTYNINSNSLLLELDRTAIVDISVGDIINITNFAEYVWTEQDSQFVESNPDARLFLKMVREKDGKYTGSGLVVISSVE